MGIESLIIGGSLLGAASSAYGSKRAASATQAGTDAATAESRRQFDITRSDLAPYISTGQGALAQLARLYGIDNPSGSTIDGSTGRVIGPRGREFAGGRTLPGGAYGGAAPARLAGPSGPDMSVFTESPDYQFNLEQGQQGIDRSLAARGKALSGQGVKEGVRFASGMASREFGSFFDRLSTLAGIGQTGAAASAAAGSTSASQIGGAAMAGGQGVANARMSGAAGVNNAIQGGLSNFLLMNYLGKGSA